MQKYFGNWGQVKSQLIGWGVTLLGINSFYGYFTDGHAALNLVGGILMTFGGGGFAYRKAEEKRLKKEAVNSSNPKTGESNEESINTQSKIQGESEPDYQISAEPKPSEKNVKRNGVILWAAIGLAVIAVVIVTNKSSPRSNSLNKAACVSVNKLASKFAEDAKQSTSKGQIVALANHMAESFLYYAKSSTEPLSSAFSKGASGFATVANAYDKQDQQSFALASSLVKSSLSAIDKICAKQ
jgi:hypothetical protein